jgi:hypothetical protein
VNSPSAKPVLSDLTGPRQEFEVGYVSIVMTDAATNKSLAQMNKSPDVGEATNTKSH